MTLANTLKQQALNAANTAHGSSLAALRAAGRDTLTQQAFPDRKTEHWKYTSLSALDAGQLTAAANGESTHAVEDFGGTQIRLINGQVPANIELPTGVTLRPLADTDTPVDTTDVFDAFNAVTVSEGLVIEVAANAAINAPVHLVFITDSDAPASASNRIHIQLGTGSSITVIEHYVGRGPALSSSVISMQVGANAALTHYRLQAESDDSLHIGNTRIFQLRDSRVRSYQLMTGNALRRNDMRVWMQEAGAELIMRGVYLARGSSHIDNHICIEHAAPHCRSDQIFKGIAGETAKAVFNGRIHIHPGACGSDAQLSNNNLLLSKSAEIDSKPELEIYNDDVKCSHGSTVGQMDHKQLFYLRSRGIDEAAAKRMLGVGFINELLLSLPDEAIAEWSRNWLAASL